MKKNFLLVAIVATMITTSCGTSKQAQVAHPNQQLAYYQPQPQQPVITEEKIAKSEVLLLSEDMSDGKMKAYGQYIHQNINFVRQGAINAAKAELASSIASLVLYVFDDFSKQDPTGFNETAKSHAKTTAENMVNDAPVLKSDMYKLSDGTYRCEVCVGTIDVAEKIVKDAIFNEEAIKLEYDKLEFEKSYQEGLNRFRQLKDAQ